MKETCSGRRTVRAWRCTWSLRLELDVVVLGLGFEIRTFRLHTLPECGRGYRERGNKNNKKEDGGTR